MKYRLLDILACPICKNWPLQFIVFNETKYEYKDLKVKTPFCRDYCGLKVNFLNNINTAELDCAECTKREITDGIILCTKCNRWYPIIEEIPVMLPDELRKEKEDKAFLEKWKNKIPENFLKNGLPFHL
ncbi:MAG TPA: Trm112 family protein [Geobacterales bacterium]|nr:Trm112 family protein [Geobacterales bacterium]